MSDLAALPSSAYATVMRSIPAILCALRRWLRFNTVLAVFVPACAIAAQRGLETFDRDTLVIETAQGARYTFNVEIARTPSQQMQGLMYRRSLAADAGMLFVYDRDAQIAMWMKNTLIPLDMVFIARDGRIVHVFERAVPLSLETITVDRPVAGVLELNGGTAARLGIAEGGRVLYPAFDGGS